MNPLIKWVGWVRLRRYPLAGGWSAPEGTPGGHEGELPGHLARKLTRVPAGQFRGHVPGLGPATGGRGRGLQAR